MVTAIPGAGTTNNENTLLLHVTLYELKVSRSFRFMVPKLELGNQQITAFLTLNLELSAFSFELFSDTLIFHAACNTMNDQ